MEPAHNPENRMVMEFEPSRHYRLYRALSLLMDYEMIDDFSIRPPCSIFDLMKTQTSNFIQQISCTRNQMDAFLKLDSEIPMFPRGTPFAEPFARQPIVMPLHRNLLHQDYKRYEFLGKDITFTHVEQMYDLAGSVVASLPEVAAFAKSLMRDTVFVTFKWTVLASEFGLPPKPEDDLDSALLQSRFGFTVYECRSFIDISLRYLFEDYPLLRVSEFPSKFALVVETFIDLGLLESGIVIDPRSKKGLIQFINAHLRILEPEGHHIIKLMEKVWACIAKKVFDGWGDDFIKETITSGKNLELRRILLYNV